MLLKKKKDQETIACFSTYLDESEGNRQTLALRPLFEWRLFVYLPAIFHVEFLKDRATYHLDD